MRLYCTLLHCRTSSNKRFVRKVWGICSRTQWVISISQTPWVITNLMSHLNIKYSKSDLHITKSMRHLNFTNTLQHAATLCNALQHPGSESKMRGTCWIDNTTTCCLLHIHTSAYTKITTLQGLFKQAIRVENERHLLTNSMSHFNLANSMSHQTSDSCRKCEALAEYVTLHSYTLNHNILLQIHA